MTATLLDGQAIAGEIRAGLVRDIAEHSGAHGPLRLVAVLVGSDPAAQLYAQSQHKRSAEAGIEHGLIELPASSSHGQVLETIQRLNADRGVTGIMLQLPLPPGIEAPAIQYHIDPYKDVEGVNPANIGLLFYDVPLIAPCTALAVNELIRRSGVSVRGAHAVVVGQSGIVGRPISMFLTTQLATVTACHAATRDLESHTRSADILVVAIGQPRFIRETHVKPGAVVIDVGINTVTHRGEGGQSRRQTVGDVDFDSVREVAGAITPVPGGVGPLTVTMLLRNTLEAARKQLERRL